MPIDNLIQLSLPHARPTAQPLAVASTAGPATARQELPPSGQAVPAPDSADVHQAVSRLNDYVQTLRRDLQFRVEEDSNRVVVTVMDSESGSVIRQIPSEELLAIARSLEVAQQGLLLNTKA